MKGKFDALALNWIVDRSTAFSGDSFFVADLDILRILTLVALGMAVSKVLYNFVRVYISVTPLTFIGKESLDEEPWLLINSLFMNYKVGETKKWQFADEQVSNLLNKCHTKNPETNKFLFHILSWVYGHTRLLKHPFCKERKL